MKVGLALGGGGVRGLAHILVLEALDQLGVRPSIIAGTSMGAIIGALYASGISGKEIRERISRKLTFKVDTWRDVVDKKDDLLQLVSAFSSELSRGRFPNAQGFFHYLFGEITARRFEDLQIPLLISTADFWTAEEVVFDSGELLPAIQASLAVPGVFRPVAIAGRVLVDGGVVNLVPYDLLIDHVDLTIAVDVSRVRNHAGKEIPGTLDAILGAFNIMQEAAFIEKMKVRRPDIYVHPEISGVRMLDFSKVEEVFAQAMPAVDLLVCFYGSFPTRQRNFF